MAANIRFANVASSTYNYNYYCLGDDCRDSIISFKAQLPFTDAKNKIKSDKVAPYTATRIVVGRRSAEIKAST